MTRHHHRDRLLKALYDASASLDLARHYASHDPLLAERIRQIALEVLEAIGRVATGKATKVEVIS